MTEWMAHFSRTWPLEPWTIKVLIALVITTFASAVARRALRRISQLAERTDNHWDDTLVHAARAPLPVLVWVIGLTGAASFFPTDPLDPLVKALQSTRQIGILACLTWFCWRLIEFGSARLVAYRTQSDVTIDRTTVDALSKLARLTLFVFAALVALQTVGFSVSGVLAAGGIGGLAIGFAAKDVLANFFGGLTIYLDRPFSVGDWIRSPDKSIEGTVEAISWRHTRIRAFNKNPIYVPNAVFTTIVVENPSRMSNRRIKETVGIRYDDIDKMAPIVAEVQEMLRTHPEIDTTQTLIVNFTEFADSSLNFMIYSFTKTREWERFHEIKQEILLKIAAIIAAHGAEIAFPTRTLHIAR